MPLSGRRCTVEFIDSDTELRNLLNALIIQVPFRIAAFARLEDYPRATVYQQQTCLLMDWPGTEVLEELCSVRERPPVIIASRIDHVPTAVGALQAGAYDYQLLPIDSGSMLARLHRAWSYHRQKLDDLRGEFATQERIQGLSDREREVLCQLLEGHHVKSIARRLKVSPKTIEFHRTRILKKMECDGMVPLMRTLMVASRQDGDNWQGFLERLWTRPQ